LAKDRDCPWAAQDVAGRPVEPLVAHRAVFVPLVMQPRDELQEAADEVRKPMSE
jgi:hypothetical protein